MRGWKISCRFWILDFGNGWRGIQDEKGQKLNDTDTVIDKQAQPKVELIVLIAPILMI
jgi:hypothetical protein